jgi:hypothetical protein
MIIGCVCTKVTVYVQIPMWWDIVVYDSLYSCYTSSFNNNKLSSLQQQIALCGWVVWCMECVCLIVVDSG